MKYILALITCSKTGNLSTTRLITLVGSFVLLSCIAFLVFSKDERLVEACPFFMAGLVGLEGFKSFQTKFEGDK